MFLIAFDTHWKFLQFLVLLQLNQVSNIYGVANLPFSHPPAPDTGGSNITGYKIEQSSTSAVAGFNVAMASTGSTATTKTITGLINGQSYWFKVYAINNIGPGTPSNVVGPVIPATVPYPP